jgi:hypothetical protein
MARGPARGAIDEPQNRIIHDRLVGAPYGLDQLPNVRAHDAPPLLTGPAGW